MWRAQEIVGSVEPLEFINCMSAGAAWGAPPLVAPRSAAPARPGVKCNYRQTEDLQPHQKHLVVAVLVWLAWVSLSGEEGRKTDGSSICLFFIYFFYVF